MEPTLYSQPIDGATVVSFRDPSVPYRDADVVNQLLTCAYKSRPRNILMDLSAVRHLPSAIIECLVSLQLQLMRDGRKLILLRVSSTLENQLSQLFLDNAFDLRDSLMDAVRFLDSCDVNHSLHQSHSDNGKTNVRYRYQPSL